MYSCEKPGTRSSTSLRNLDRAAILEVIDGDLEDVFRNRHRVMLVKLHVRRALELDLRRGGDDLGVEVLREADQRLHDALHIDDHRFDRAREDGEFLMEEVAGRGHALPHQDFIRRAADTGQIHAVARPPLWRTR